MIHVLGLSFRYSNVLGANRYCEVKKEKKLNENAPCHAKAPEQRAVYLGIFHDRRY